MTWQEIRKAYPGVFVLLKNYHEEIINTDKIRIIDGEVVFSSADSKEVYHQYNSCKNRDDVVFGYTGWENFDVEERPFLGIRPSHD